MARRKNNNGFVTLILEGSWTLVATVSLACFVASFYLPIYFSRPYLQGLGATLSSMAKNAGLLFAVIALIKLIYASYKKQLNKLPSIHNAQDIKISDQKPPQLQNNWSLHCNLDNVTQPLEISKTLIAQKPLVWSLKLMQDLEWKKFEELCVNYYQEKGLRAEATSLGADGGIDIKLYEAEQWEPSSIVQCKAWASDVGVRQMREFLGVMAHENIQKGIYMSASAYTPDAKKLAQEHGIICYTGEMLLMDIKRLGMSSQQRLLMLATAGDYTTPTCPKCDIKMIKRNSRTGSFWGCQNYSKGCKQRLHLRKLDDKKAA